MRLLRLALVAALAASAAVPAGASAERYRRDVSWSGYRWQVRLAQHENPSNNNWGDAPANVRVRADGMLRLAITRTGGSRRSVEVVTKRRLGYGRYRWVVASPLGHLDLNSVLALFTDDVIYKSPWGEQIFEFGRWNDPTALPGWAVSWSRRTKSYDSFALTDLPPYTAEITWRAGSVRLALRDGARTVLYDRTRPVASNGHWMAARMSYWMYPGAPAAFVPPPVLLRSFHFTPLARL